MKARSAAGASTSGGDCSSGMLAAVDQDLCEGEMAAGQAGGEDWDPETVAAAAEAVIAQVKGWMEEQEMKALEVRSWPPVHCRG